MGCCFPKEEQDKDATKALLPEQKPATVASPAKPAEDASKPDAAAAPPKGYSSIPKDDPVPVGLKQVEDAPVKAPSPVKTVSPVKAAVAAAAIEVKVDKPAELPKEDKSPMVEAPKTEAPKAEDRPSESDEFKVVESKKKKKGKKDKSRDPSKEPEPKAKVEEPVVASSPKAEEPEVVVPAKADLSAPTPANTLESPSSKSSLPESKTEETAPADEESKGSFSALAVKTEGDEEEEVPDGPATEGAIRESRASAEDVESGSRSSTASDAKKKAKKAVKKKKPVKRSGSAKPGKGM